MVYVDQMQAAFRGMIMCHMLADTLEELHTMADRIGLKREWYQPKSTPHYDVSKSKRREALKAGAVEIDDEQLVALIVKWRGEAGISGVR